MYVTCVTVTQDLRGLLLLSNGYAYDLDEGTYCRVNDQLKEYQVMNNMDIYVCGLGRWEGREVSQQLEET